MMTNKLAQFLGKAYYLGGSDTLFPVGAAFFTNKISKKRGNDSCVN